MQLVIERETATKAGNVPGRLYVDGVFFGYTLENDSLKIPEGYFVAYDRWSPKFFTNKVHIDVPGRNYIMFHGGNDATIDSEGCVLVARNRISGNYIQGDASGNLYAIVAPKLQAGEIVTVRVKKKINWIVAAAVVAAVGYVITR